MEVNAIAVPSSTTSSTNEELTTVRFHIKCYTAVSESVVIVGDCPQLGDGAIEKAHAMQLQHDKYPLWTTSVKLPSKREISYSYAIVRQRPAMSVRMEARDPPQRKLKTRGRQIDLRDGIFVEGDSTDASPMGSHIRDLGRGSHVLHHDDKESDDWLGSGYQLRILFGHGNDHGRSSPIDSMENSIVRSIVCTQISTSRSLTLPIASQKLDPMRQLDEEMVFHAVTLQGLTLQIEVIGSDSFAKGKKKEVLTGTAFLTTGTLEALCGRVSLPVISPKLIPVGHIALEFLVVCPFSHPEVGAVTSRTFIKDVEHLHMGHRGMGSNQALSSSGRKTAISENTVLGFNTAHKKGSDFVEFDVQLTLDKIPVIYHDFWIKSKSVGGVKLLLPVTQLTLKKFRKLHPNYRSEKGKQNGKLQDTQESNIDRTTVSRKDGRIRRTVSDYSLKSRSSHIPIQETFPTLEEVYLQTPETLGFDIEIKYPTLKENQTAHAYERNDLVDSILNIVYKFSSSERLIFFSSFDPQVCVILSMKQPRYPVFFLTHGRKTCECDPRRNSLHAALAFAKSTGMHGLCCHTKPLLMSPILIKLIKREGLLLFTWGSENNSKQNIRIQKQHGVDAIISDHELSHAASAVLPEADSPFSSSSSS